MQTTLRETLHEAGLAGRFAEVTPDFGFEQFEPGHWWIVDGDVRVGLVVRGYDFAELVNVDPLEPRRDVAFPDVYHAPTSPGDRITMAKWTTAQATTSQHNDLAFTCDGQSVTATFTEWWASGGRASKTLVWRVDPDFGYVLHGEDTMRWPEPDNLEYCNFLPGGTTGGRPEGARSAYTLWEHPSGRIVRWNHNPIGARALGAMDLRDRRRIRTGGFIGFFGRSGRAAAIELLESSPETTSRTNPTTLAEHIQWAPAPLVEYEWGDDESYGSHAAYNVVSVPSPVAEMLTARAEMLDMVVDRVDRELDAEYAWCDGEFPRKPGEPRRLRFCPFVPGRVADFETRLDPADTFRGQVLAYPDDDPKASVSVVSDEGRSGTHSLRIRATGRRVRACAVGGSFHAIPGRRYRVGAWLKTDLARGTAVVRARQWLLCALDATVGDSSQPLAGTSDWRRVAVEFTPGPDACAMDVVVDVDGVGTVWVDDILLERLD